MKLRENDIKDTKKGSRKLGKKFEKEEEER
jgi:hypothetical protein